MAGPFVVEASIEEFTVAAVTAEAYEPYAPVVIAGEPIEAHAEFTAALAAAEKLATNETLAWDKAHSIADQLEVLTDVRKAKGIQEVALDSEYAPEGKVIVHFDGEARPTRDGPIRPAGSSHRRGCASRA